jgi:hypothetical protein
MAGDAQATATAVSVASRRERTVSPMIADAVRSVDRS